MLARNAFLYNRYRIIRSLGKGGFGHVYEAIDDKLDCIVAIKERLAKLDSEKMRRAFEREAKLLANLRHPVLPKVTDHFFAGEGQYLVMEFIEGDDLAKLLSKRQHPFPVEQLLPWADEILKALIYLHTRPEVILHRDIKPANIKLTNEGEIFLLDFGLAKGYAGKMALPETSQRSSSIHGYTAAYAPLEQLTKSGTNEQSDIYSLGATLYHLLTGRLPVSAAQRYKSIELGQRDPLLPAHEVSPVVPLPVSLVLSQSMAMSRKDRIRSAAEMRQALMEANRAIVEAQAKSYEEPAATPAPQDALEPEALAPTAPSPSVQSPIVSSPAPVPDTTLPVNPSLFHLQPSMGETPAESQHQSESWPSHLSSQAEDSPWASTIVESELQDDEDITEQGTEELERQQRIEDELDRGRRAEEARKEAEEKRLRAEEEQRLRLEAAEAQRRADREARERAAEEEERRRAEAAAIRLAEEEAVRRAEEERLRDEARAARLRAEEERQRRIAEEAARQRRAEAEARGRAEQEDKRRAEEAKRQLAEAEIRRRAKEEEERKRLAERAGHRVKEERGLAAEAEANRDAEAKTGENERRPQKRWLPAAWIIIPVALLALVITVFAVIWLGYRSRETTRGEGSPGPAPQSLPSEVPSRFSSSFLGELRTNSEVFDVALSRDGRLLASTGNENKIRVWEVSGRTPLSDLTGYNQPGRILAISPDGQTIASGNNDGSIRLWNLADASLIRTIPAHGKYVFFIRFSKDGQTLVSAGADKLIRQWRVNDGKLLIDRALTGTGYLIVTISPDQQVAALYNPSDREVHLFSVNDDREINVLENRRDGISSGAFSPDGQLLVLGTANGTVRIWRANDGRIVSSLRGSKVEVSSVAFSPDGQLLAIGWRDGAVRLMRVGDKDWLKTLEGHASTVNSLAFSGDGQVLASGSKDKTIKLWQLTR